jgi:hypothetical protein
MNVPWIDALVRCVPEPVKRAVKRRRLFVRERSQFVHVFHACLHKSASQWIRGLLADLRTFRYSGLTVYSYEQDLPGGFDPRRIVDRRLEDPFPPHTFITPLYVDYDNFRRAAKAEPWRAFFVMRDPRDLVVSWYFSMKHSHRPVPSDALFEVRRRLNAVDAVEGLAHCLRLLGDSGTFLAMESWLDAAPGDQRILLLKYEDLVGEAQADWFERLFVHGDVRMPRPVQADLLRDHSFERLAGRTRGREDAQSHYRKGVAGDWRRHLTAAHEALLEQYAGAALRKAGYVGDGGGVLA